MSAINMHTNDLLGLEVIIGGYPDGYYPNNRLWLLGYKHFEDYPGRFYGVTLIDDNNKKHIFQILYRTEINAYIDDDQCVSLFKWIKYYENHA